MITVKKRSTASVAVSLPFDQGVSNYSWFTNTSTCICPVDLDSAPVATNDTKTARNAQQGFLFSFNLELETLRENGLVTVVSFAEDLEEGQNVQCAATEKDFFTEVFSDLKVNLTTFTTQQARRLERAFLDSYNRQAFELCDGFFRTITDVQLRVTNADSSNPGRRLQDVIEEIGVASTLNGTVANNTINRRNQLVATLFTVTGSWYVYITLNRLLLA